MKRAIALLLALVMVFALCGCGVDKAGTAVKTTGEGGQNETPQNSTISVMPREITVTQPNFQVQTIKLTDETDYLEISNPKLTKVNGSIYRFGYDAKCLFPQNLGVEYPNLIIIHHQYVDKDGNGERSANNNVYSFTFGQSFTMEPTEDTEAYLMRDYLLDISEIESISFTTYEMKNSTASPSWLGNWQFIKPVKYGISDLLPKDEIEAAKEWAEKGIDPISVELVRSENGKDYLRIVNTGDTKQDHIMINYQVLDKDGDIIGTSNITVHDLEAGQGAKKELRPNSEASAIKIVEYVYPHTRGNGMLTSVEETFNMKNPITIKID